MAVTHMKKILVAFATMAGSTREVASVVSEQLIASGFEVDVLPISAVKSLSQYDGLVLGGPMIMGWHRAALGFLQKHRRALQQVPVAIFVLAMSLTQTGDTLVDNPRIFVDEKLPKPPLTENRLSFRERYATLRNYVTPILKSIRPAQPVSLAVFGGRLEYGRLPWWAVLFAMLIIQAPAGDRRNWPAIKSWAANLGPAFGSPNLITDQHFYSIPQDAQASINQST